ncbi:hypothetical protein FF1_047189 [Malus domestica]
MKQLPRLAVSCHNSRKKRAMRQAMKAAQESASTGFSGSIVAGVDVSWRWRLRGLEIVETELPVDPPSTIVGLCVCWIAHNRA